MLNEKKTGYYSPDLMVLAGNIEGFICTSPSATTEGFNELTEIEW